MKQQAIGQTDLMASSIILGCMRMAALDHQEAKKLLAKVLDLGINMIDHADIYGKGESESRYQQAAKELGVSRDQVILQSKCGIRQGFFDFSKDHIIASVEASLSRLGADYLDLLLLHRPDALVEPEEVAQAFEQLKKEGKVRHFGLSNHNRFQVELLQSYLDDPLVVNQMQLSPAHTPMIDAGLNVNMKTEAAFDRDNGMIEYSRLKGMTLQAWSPFQIDLAKGLFAGHPDYQELNQTISRLANHYGVSDEAIVIAWILRHPAKIQMVVGSMNPERWEKMVKADHITLSREEWYAIYRSAGNSLL
ncbi:aldo/keto reductase [Streptococcus ictaluri]|uniref:Oxidoreductase, aldo/keto reductase family protein n=1 Tax=Streptococcus ictaluri 707-05 TaxID=764299 RepID=G5JZZ4_9STRE|nr:aldo/keto reductase [Streptococcus ictaluri]EHI70838.1 oxidoreductase, aldo/keto reductase family protein [Streptococcus ictaluri 707-05]